MSLAKGGPKPAETQNSKPVQPPASTADIGKTYLIAAAKGDLSTVKKILENPDWDETQRRQFAEYRDPGNYNRTALILASRNGHLPVVAYLINEVKIDVFACDNHELKSLAVHFAAELGHLDIVQLFLDTFPELLEAADSSGRTCLNLAAFSGQLRIVEYLVEEKKADIETKGAFGRTPLLSAVEQGHLRTAKFLITKGADVSAKSSSEGNNDGAIHLAAAIGYLDIVKFLVDLDADMLTVRNMLGETALNLATMAGQLKVVEYLVSERKLDIEIRGQFDRTPLLQAADEGQLEIVRFLVDRGANFMACDDHGDSCLHLAAYYGHPKLVSLLLELNKELAAARNSNRLTPLALAKERKHEECVAAFKNKGVFA